MTRPDFGSRKFGRHGDFNDLQALPERKIMTFRNFRMGYTPNEQRQMVNEAASPNTHDFEIRPDNRLQRTPGTVAQLAFGTRTPSRMFLHPTLTSMVEAGFVAGSEIGFRNTAGIVEWFDIGMVDRGEFAHTIFGGTLIFTDGIRVWERETTGSPIELLPDAPMARTYATFAGRVFAGSAIIDGQFEPLGIQWSGVSSNYRDWDGLGSGNELLVNDVSVGDRIVKLVPMGFDMMAVMMRQSVWVGRFTGQVLRPADFSPRVPGIGAVNDKTVALTHYGVMFLSDNGVYLFDGNSVQQVSEAIRTKILPLDFTKIDEYHATYDPVKKRYILFTPTEYWQFELEHQRWLNRKFTAVDSAMFPTQIDGVRWFEAVGQWAEQTDLIWLDFAGKNLGELKLWMLGDQLFTEERIERAVGEESYRSGAYFGDCMNPYWESKLFDEQDAQRLVTSVKQLIEYEGTGNICVLLPNEDNQYETVAEVGLALREYPSTAVLNAGKVGKGTGIAICLRLDCRLENLPEEEDFPPVPPPEPPPEPPPPPPEEGWSGFQFFTDVHSCTPEIDAQQIASAELACFTYCDEPACGGLGGWLVWYSSDPTDLSLGCDSPNNPIPGLRGL